MNNACVFLNYVECYSYTTDICLGSPTHFKV